MKILLLSCKTGGGHDAAANALKEQFEKMGHTAFVFDYLTLAGEKVSKRVANTYVKTVQVAPKVFGCVYKLGMAVSKRTKNSPVYKVNKKMDKYLEKYLEENHYDAIVMTHLYPAETITWMKRKGDIVPKDFAVLTDYTLTPFWEETECSEYIIPHPSLADECVERGLPREKLHPFGIPFSPRILSSLTKEEACEKLGLDKDKKTILLIGGSMGAGKLTALTKAFNKSDELNKLQIVVICGNNQKIYNQQIKKYKDNKAFVVIGHTTDMPLYMKASDIVYTKPGGLTSTETVASRTPMIITYPIPGCETANKDFFLKLHMAKSAKKPKDLVKVGLDLLNNEQELQEIKKAQEENIDEHATEKIAKFILENIGIKEN